MLDKPAIARVFTRTVELLEESGDDAALRSDYSGRGMYGDTCPAIVTDASGVKVGILFAVAYSEIAREVEGGDFEFGYCDPYDIYGNAPLRSDNMCLSAVYY